MCGNLLEFACLQVLSNISEILYTKIIILEWIKIYLLAFSHKQHLLGTVSFDVLENKVVYKTDITFHCQEMLNKFYFHLSGDW